ncbi:MAG: peptidoglycan editing factor PgeF [Janthinobacterium lividum]
MSEQRVNATSAGSDSSSTELESPEAIGAVDAILAGVGLQHGRRATRTDSWHAGERRKTPRQMAVRAPDTTSDVQPGIERVAGWDRFPWLRAGFSTRQGGGSTIYGEAEQNLGCTREDDPQTVADNRARFVAAVAGDATMQLVTSHQIHGGLIRDLEVEHLELEPEALMTAGGKATRRADGLLSRSPGRLLGILTADCVPVLVADTRTHAVAAFHAGWRGTLARIVERGIGSLRLRYGSRPEDLIAAIGPAIGACCYSVSEEVRFDFESQFSYAPSLFSELYDSDPVRDKYPLLFLTARAPGHSNIGPQIHLNLPESNRHQLLDAGLRPENISILAECTACSRLPNGRRKYYSHRDEHGFAGRMLSVIGSV